VLADPTSVCSSSEQPKKLEPRPKALGSCGAMIKKQGRTAVCLPRRSEEGPSTENANKPGMADFGYRLIGARGGGEGRDVVRLNFLGPKTTDRQLFPEARYPKKTAVSKERSNTIAWVGAIWGPKENKGTMFALPQARSKMGGPIAGRTGRRYLWFKKTLLAGGGEKGNSNPKKKNPKGGGGKPQRRADIMRGEHIPFSRNLPEEGKALSSRKLGDGGESTLEVRKKRGLSCGLIPSC